jgi:hypothetical protein
MPLIQWIMQNLQPTSDGVVVDGVALVKKLINQIGNGGVEVSGTAENIVIISREGVVINGFASVSQTQNYAFTGGVVVDGAAFVEISKEFKKKIQYLPGETVYFNSQYNTYTVLGFYYDLDDKIKYEIANPNKPTIFVYEQDLARDNESYLLFQLNKANKMIDYLSA